MKFTIMINTQMMSIWPTKTMTKGGRSRARVFVGLPTDSYISFQPTIYVGRILANKTPSGAEGRDAYGNISRYCQISENAKGYNPKLPVIVSSRISLSFLSTSDINMTVASLGGGGGVGVDSRQTAQSVSIPEGS